MSTLITNQLHPGLSLDCVIFGFHNNELKLFLLKLKTVEQWALPGGFVYRHEDVDQAVGRILEERTGVRDIYLQQFHLFGAANRIPENHAQQMVEHGIIPQALSEWFSQRFVSLGYYALVEYSRVTGARPDHTSDFCEWYAIDQLPPLMIDHHIIILKAYETLKQHLHTKPIGLNLLPKRFTMPELQALYETVLGKKLDRRNFQRKMLSYDILLRTDQRRTGGSHRAPWLYEFDEEKYHRALEEGW